MNGWCEWLGMKLLFNANSNVNINIANYLVTCTNMRCRTVALIVFLVTIDLLLFIWSQIWTTRATFPQPIQMYNNTLQYFKISYPPNCQNYYFHYKGLHYILYYLNMPFGGYPYTKKHLFIICLFLLLAASYLCQTRSMIYFIPQKM